MSALPISQKEADVTLNEFGVWAVLVERVKSDEPDEVFRPIISSKVGRPNFNLWDNRIQALPSGRFVKVIISEQETEELTSDVYTTSNMTYGLRMFGADVRGGRFEGAPDIYPTVYDHTSSQVDSSFYLTRNTRNTRSIEDTGGLGQLVIPVGSEALRQPERVYTPRSQTPSTDPTLWGGQANGNYLSEDTLNTLVLPYDWVRLASFDLHQHVALNLSYQLYFPDITTAQGSFYKPKNSIENLLAREFIRAFEQELAGGQDFPVFWKYRDFVTWVVGSSDLGRGLPIQEYFSYGVEMADRLSDYKEVYLTDPYRGRALGEYPQILGGRIPYRFISTGDSEELSRYNAFKAKYGNEKAFFEQFRGNCLNISGIRSSTSGWFDLTATRSFTQEADNV